ncbi:MAG: pyridoxal-phosphate dependent enzyme [Gammaproteobacteria bacterium]|nr:pyridoxal-phosphate dependent enzyme [Gammaproteobacteria bacterium]
MHDSDSLSCMDSSFLNLPSPVTQLHHPLLEAKKLQLFIKRDELIHPHLQGNKWRKLKYNLLQARRNGHSTLLTFGGAYSNHIHATAAAGHYFNFRTIGIIRGEQHLPLNPTLQDAKDWGMALHYVSRAEYREKTSPAFIEKLITQFSDFYLIPEGGNNEFATRGCVEIIDELEDKYDAICVDCGTGATMTGIIAGLENKSRVLGFAVLKGADFLQHDVTRQLQQYTHRTFNNWALIPDYHFGGFARTKPELIEFIKEFKQQFDIQLEPVYSGKMLFGIFDLIKQDYFPDNTRILAIHGGGLQGLRGFAL